MSLIPRTTRTSQGITNFPFSCIVFTLVFTGTTAFPSLMAMVMMVVMMSYLVHGIEFPRTMNEL